MNCKMEYGRHISKWNNKEQHLKAFHLRVPFEIQWLLVNFKTEQGNRIICLKIFFFLFEVIIAPLKCISNYYIYNSF